MPNEATTSLTITVDVVCPGQPDQDRRRTVIGRAGEMPIGELKLTIVHNKLIRIEAIEVTDQHDYPQVAALLIDRARSWYSGTVVEASIWDRHDDARLRAVLESQGFEMYIEKVYVERAIAGYKSPYHSALSFRSLAELGAGPFVKTLARIYQDDRCRDARPDDPEGDFQGMIEYAGPAFNAATWKLALLEEDIVGLILPQAYHDRLDRGTLFYMGIVPEFRGRNWAKILHADGLEFLASAGATTYIGSTDIINLAMLRVFAENGCEQTGVRRLYRPAALKVVD